MTEYRTWDGCEYELRTDGEDISKECGMGHSLDEVIAIHANVHIERMGKNCYWIGITLKDGTELRTIIQSTRAPIHCWVEVERPDVTEMGNAAGKPTQATE